MATPPRSLLLAAVRLAARRQSVMPPRLPCSLRHFITERSSPEIVDEGTANGATGEDDEDLRSRIWRLRLSKRSATAALERWVGEGRPPATASHLREIARELRRARRYKHALEVSEWMRTHHETDLFEGDYGSHIDLIMKVFGVSAAEDFFKGLPPNAKCFEAYTALLHSYAHFKLTNKAEDLFERMKEENFPVNVLAYNEMMTLYISIGELDKVPILVEDLKANNVSPDLFTYNLWISSCAASLNVNGVRKILNEIILDANYVGGWVNYVKLVDIYVHAGQLTGSSNSIVETDTKISQREWITYDFLMILHAGLGNGERIREIWESMKMTSQKLTSRNYVCILSSFLVLGRLHDAGDIIEQWKQSKAPEFDMSACNRLLDTLMKVGLLDTAGSFRKLMLEKSCMLKDIPE